VGNGAERFVPSDGENPEHLRATLPAVAPINGVTDSPARCYRINTDYVGFLIAGVDTYVHSDAFFGSAVEREEAASRFVDLQILLMTGNLLCGENSTMMLRQNPNDPCQLQQSFDNGASWSLAFDYALCLSKALPVNSLASANASATAIAVAEAHAEIWVGDYHDIAPGMHYDLSDSDESRDQAYCFAIQLLLLQMSAALTVVENSGWDGWDVLEVVSAVTEVASRLLLGAVKTGLIQVHPLVYAGTVVAGTVSSVLNVLLDIYTPGTDVDHFLDAATQGALLCCGWGAMGGMTPDFSRFSQMFVGCDDSNLSDFMQDFADGVVAEQETYLAFLALIEEAFQAIDGGQQFNCPCDTEVITFEFETESGSAENTYYGLSGWEVPEANAGMLTYVPEGGCFFGDEETGDFTNHRGVNIKRGGISGDIDSVEIIGNQSLGVQSGSGRVAGIAYGGDGQVWDKSQENAGDPASYKRVAYRTLVDAEINVDLVSDFRQGFEPVYTGSCKISRIIIRGSNLSVD